MKVVLSTVVLALAVAAAYAEVEAPKITAVDYHRRIGIPKAAAIRREEASQSPATRIVGGNVVDISNVPYQAGLIIQILFILTSVCGASLISETRLVTAAHCYTDGLVTAQSFTVVLGSNFLFTGGTRITTTDIVVHPAWNPFLVTNDIAILRIPAVTFSNAIQPIALPSGADAVFDFVGQYGLASGYGATSDGLNIGVLQRVSAVVLQVVDNVVCTGTYGILYVRPSTLCTSGANGLSTCTGDSGGPLVVDRNSGKVLVGVTSFGHVDGCQAGHPVAFARITTFLPWINFVLFADF